MLHPVRIKGIPSPSEYALKSKIPLLMESCWLAIARIAARMGPIHGVQPNANASPTRNDPARPNFLPLE